MPEGPEVRRIALRLRNIDGLRIEEAEVVSGRYRKKHIAEFETLVGSVILSTGVKGKLIVVTLQDGRSILSTLGMAGWWERHDQEEVTKNKKYLRLQFKLSDGTFLRFFDPRNFGTFRIASYEETLRKLNDLGPDIMSNKDTWYERELPMLLNRWNKFAKGTVAEALLDQRIFCGVGNYIRADAAYLAATWPLRRAQELDHTEVVKLWLACAKVAEASFLGVHPFLKGEPFMNLVYGQSKCPEGCTIERVTDKNGRTVWYTEKDTA